MAAPTRRRSAPVTAPCAWGSRSASTARSIQVTLRAERRGERLVFQVSDTGIGMDERQLEPLFNRFQQADGSIARRFGGTGLGLAISKRLVELMHGDIRVVSSPGLGSRFEVDLPYVPCPPVPATDPGPGPQRPGKPLAGISILVAEADPINQGSVCISCWGWPSH